MSKFFIFLLFALNLVYFNHAMATSCIEQTVVYNEEGKPDDGKDDEKKDGEKNPDEEECE